MFFKDVFRFFFVRIFVTMLHLFRNQRRLSRLQLGLRLRAKCAGFDSGVSSASLVDTYSIIAHLEFQTV